MKWLVPVAFVALLAVRSPSVAQPAGGDQGLYACVAQEISRGGLPYRDAWDQKPPAIHYTYALMFALWSNERVVAATDLVVAALVALLLVAIGRRLWGQRGPGEAAALLFLLLGNPAFSRLSGLWLRSQCETFIALAITAGLLLLVPRQPPEPGRGSSPPSLAACVAAGVLFGFAFLYKYNAAIYLIVAAVAILAVTRTPPYRGLAASRTRSLLVRWLALTVGAAVPVAVAALLFVQGGAWQDLYQATFVYNLEYSGETYGGLRHFLAYLVSFPVERSSVDALWMLGGLGTAILLLSSWRRPVPLVAPVWVAAACLSIAANGSRGLPQYFVQAAPALALAAGLAGAQAWRVAGRWPQAVLVLLLTVAVARVNQFDKLAENTWFDARYLAGHVPERDYLARFGGQRETDKFSALAVRELGDYLRERTAPDDRVFVFGFSGGAYVRARRQSASRFFWSRPIIVGFNAGRPGYGAEGLRADLDARPPKYVALQQRDWPAEPSDSATYFLNTPVLRGWLEAGYVLVTGTDTYLIYARHDGPAGALSGLR